VDFLLQPGLLGGHYSTSWRGILLATVVLGSRVKEIVKHLLNGFLYSSFICVIKMNELEHQRCKTEWLVKDKRQRCLFLPPDPFSQRLVSQGEEG